MEKYIGWYVLVLIVAGMGACTLQVFGPDLCRDRRAWSIGNDTLGASGTYCAD